MPWFKDLRAIQYEYSLEGGLVVVEWEIEGGRFDRFGISIDGELPIYVAGTSSGARIETLIVGIHEITVEGIWEGGVATETVLIDVLPESPVEPPQYPQGLFYGYDPASRTGFLQISWWILERSPDDPYVEFEIYLNGEFLWRAAAPETAVTFSGISEGIHSVSLLGITRTHASLPVKIDCRAQGLPSPRNVQFQVGCEEGEGTGVVRYQTPRGTVYDAVGIWVGDGNRWDFYGYFQPRPALIRLYELPEKFVQVEVVGALFEADFEDPFAISNLPGKPGTHAIARNWVNCAGRVEFRRGDVEADGRIDITDAIKLLSFLFLGGVAPSCLSTADIDDNDGLEITDCILLINYMFTGGSPPAPPGPDICGEDPTPGAFPDCAYDACSNFGY